MHNVRPPLNHLPGKDVPWIWSDECEEAFCQLKSMLSSDLLLTHYNPALPIVVAADASAKGIGAVILHVFPDGTEKAIMHASRSLTTTEQRYGQIEKEALALVFAVRRFHKLIYGRRFTLLTDHKPHDPWIEGTIARRHGKVMFDVKVGRDTWSRHRNQLRLRKDSATTNRQTSIPQDVIFDTFQLPPPMATLVKTDRDQVAADRSSPPRQSSRKRQKPTLLQVNPKKKRY
ncbi:unnamed protein product [Mesocestoides corti]|uniref:RT_RNaseH_2 domain-containing protein n=1 Tax=Mesocestoides corti TaxID=53468 RepID=A0A0R3URP1_MESCO|nr:unnamed protein product [Mesocestoides corti]